MAKDKFSRDMDTLLSKIRTAADARTMDQLYDVRNRLVDLNKKRLVQVNHSVMEVICARYLIDMGYTVEVEYPIGNGELVTDIFATCRRQNDVQDAAKHACIVEEHGLSQESETLMVEVETGFVPPMAALTPVHYSRARMAAKAARYSGHSHLFAFATPVFNVLPIPAELFDPPDKRDRDAIGRLKDLCDVYYQSPPVTWESLAMSEIDMIYVIDVDSTNVSQVDASEYRGTVLAACNRALCGELENKPQ